MISSENYRMGTIVSLKKTHPSGTQEWVVIRLGVDIKVQSTLKKSVFIMVPRNKFHRIVNKIVKY